MGQQYPSVIKYLEPLTRDLFTVRFADYIFFNEEHFPVLGGDFKYQEKEEYQEIDWNAKSISSSDLRTKEIELQVRRIIGL